MLHILIGIRACHLRPKVMLVIQEEACGILILTFQRFVFPTDIARNLKLKSTDKQWRAEGVANGATAPGIQGRRASKELNYTN